jgi:hypothetical protein
MSEFLSSQELRELTDCAQREAQKAVLAREGVPFKEVGRRIVVSRLHARLWLEGKPVRSGSGLRLDLVR